jgi:homocysteine S-methyltransferase
LTEISPDSKGSSRPSVADPLGPILVRQGVVVLDGGLATELERRGIDLDDPLWSARSLLERPEAVRAVHLDYLEAGADCLITASYQATFEGLAARGLDRQEAEAVLRRAVTLACEVRDAWWSHDAGAGRVRPLVAASVGPYGACLADGSEYTGAYGIGVEALVDFHRRRLGVLARAGADLLACETVPSGLEARALVRLLGEVGVPAWVSLSCRDGASLRDGSPVAEVGAEVVASPDVVAVGVNCTAPVYVRELLERLAGITHKPLVAYPNSGEAWDAARRAWIPGRGGCALARLAPRWVEAGARLVGGCCRTGPEDVAAIRRALLGDG